MTTDDSVHWMDKIQSEGPEKVSSVVTSFKRHDIEPEKNVQWTKL